MAADLMLDFDSNLRTHYTAINRCTGDDISNDQDGEWDIELLDALENIADPDALLQALENMPDVGGVPNLDFGVDQPPWDASVLGDTGNSCADMTVDFLSPNPTMSLVSSPDSVDGLSPYHSHEEALSPETQGSPASVSSETSGTAHTSPQRTLQRKSGHAPRAKSSHHQKRLIKPTPIVSIQPKPLLPVPMPHPTAPLQPKAIVFQPLQTAFPVTHAAPVAIHPAPPTGSVMAQPMRGLPPRSPQVLLPPATVVLPNQVVVVPNLTQGSGGPSVGMPPATPQPAVMVTFRGTEADRDCGVGRRQQRMMKNRESASLSRRKKKEHMLTLEARLKVALSENRKLRSENGTLRTRLSSLVAENNDLKMTAPKRRAVCLLVVLAFVLLNVGPMGVFEGDPSSKLSTGTPATGRHLLGFSTGNENSGGPEKPETYIPQTAERWEEPVLEEKALMVVKKDPLLLRPPPPCQPAINRTKAIKLASELRGWVHRHEVERTKTRRTTGRRDKTKTMLRAPNKKAEFAELVTVRYTENNSGSELQVYYAQHRSYSDFFEEIQRRGDTFYVVSFRRDHLLLPATNHSKGSRPKMSVVLPAMTLKETVIKDEEYEVMMQIDCEVMDTRILHLKTSSIPAFLRANRTDTYHSSAGDGQATPPVGVLTGSA